jgi:hypothetical protein
MSTPSPDEARDALNRADEVRLNTVESLRTPWWLWAALGAVLALFVAANDYSSAVQTGASLGIGVLVVAWVVAGRRSPRIAAASGTLHRSTLPGYAWMPVLLIGAISGIAQHFARPAVHDMLTDSGMPAWIRKHPNTTAALPYAVLSVAVGLLINTVARRTALRTAMRRA